MTTRDFTANVISATKVVPDGNFKDSKASGVWDINEALDLIKGGNWPNVANFNPASFVDGLFQTHVFDTTGAELSINNGIDLSNKGGLVWLKSRSNSGSNELFDTERGVNKILFSDANTAETNSSLSLTSFNTNGFTLNNNLEANVNNRESVSWTFRKQPKFFDIVKYSGSGESGQTINHSLGVAPGMVIVKDMSATSSWYVYHRSLNSGEHLKLNSSNEVSTDSNYEIGKTTASATQFSIDTGSEVDASGNDYIAYFFAHNNDDGGFGEPGDQDIIKCGSYTGNGSSTGPSINLGFEPQWLMLKNASTAYNWIVVDVIRGFSAAPQANTLFWNTTATEDPAGTRVKPTSTGFEIITSSFDYNKSGDKFIYMAIRRGGMQTPTAASDVFDLSTGDNSSGNNAGFPADLIIRARTDTGANREFNTRLLGETHLDINTTNTEASATVNFDNMTTFNGTGWGTNFDFYNWKRARGYFDVVAYTGDSTSKQDINHNLGVEPEMIWIKNRDQSGYNFIVGTGAIGWDYYLSLTNNAGRASSTAYFGNTAPTSSVFSVGQTAGQDDTNRTTYKYVAYLFATVAGVSKVGSFTQSGATNVDCGFTGDTPSLIILKRRDATGNWYLFDSGNGIVSGNDPHIYLHTNDAPITNADLVDPYSGGFATTSSITNGDYIFYAIAAVS